MNGRHTQNSAYGPLRRAGTTFLRYAPAATGDAARCGGRGATSRPAPSRPARVIRWTGAMQQRSPVHEIVNELWRALHELGSPAATGEIERWGFSIHAALSASGRE